MAKLPRDAKLHERVQGSYWAALEEATSPTDAEARLRTLVGKLAAQCPSAAACLADDLPALTVHLTSRSTCASDSAPPTFWSAPSRRCDGAPR